MIKGRSSINEMGHLVFGGADVTELAHRYGTPLYIMDEEKIRNNCQKFKRSITHHYDGNGLPHYASKAFTCKEMCRLLIEEGMGLDVVSGGELYTALSVGFPADKIHFHGNNKTRDELEFALENNVTVVVDNFSELEVLNSLASYQDKTVKIFLRIKPGIEAHTHKYIETGQYDSKFGFALETGEALSAVKSAIQSSNLSLIGIHCHIGSQIFEIKPFILAADVMITFMASIRKETNYIISCLNLGGGFGIQYDDNDNPPDYEEYMSPVSMMIHKRCEDLDFPLPYINIEPGRSIVGEAGITVYGIGSVKSIPGVRTYISVDGGMTDNPRYILYQSKYDAIVANKADQPRDFEVTIAGRCCETGDLLQEGIFVQKCVPGDLLAVFSTGAYNHSMASNYNRVPKLPVVFVKSGKDRIVVIRESYEDLVRNDV